MYPDPDPQSWFNPDRDPDPGRIQVHKISKFSKHFLIFESKKKTFNFQVILHLLFKRFRIETYNFLRKLRFLLVKLCFSLHFISDFMPLDPDPDPDSESGSGSTDPNESGSTSLLTTLPNSYFFMHYSVFSIQYSVFSIQYSVFSIQYSTVQIVLSATLG